MQNGYKTLYWHGFQELCCCPTAPALSDLGFAVGSQNALDDVIHAIVSQIS